MKVLLAAMRRAQRLMGAESATSLPGDPTLSTVLGILEKHGLKLAVVSEHRSDLQISSRHLIEAAMARAVAAGESQAGLRERIARLIDRDKARIARALAGAELDDEARAALEAHLREPGKHPLPPAGRPPGRPAWRRNGADAGESEP
ncbi:hypothetical protein [Sorangium sp. So ce233]|uniref:hypothetical protein n=1 Tax=Sorangium sp. So ce233 TaxID=3133290 RepID=UPI003F6474A2